MPDATRYIIAVGDDVPDRVIIDAYLEGQSSGLLHSREIDVYRMSLAEWLLCDVELCYRGIELLETYSKEIGRLFRQGNFPVCEDSKLHFNAHSDARASEPPLEAIANHVASTYLLKPGTFLVTVAMSEASHQATRPNGLKMNDLWYKAMGLSYFPWYIFKPDGSHEVI